MKVVALETLQLAEFPFLFWLRVHTDAGIVGTGETFWAPGPVASYIHVRRGLNLPLAKARSFYGIRAAAMAIGVVIGISGINPISALYWAAVINAVISVPVMVAVMVAAGSRKVMGEMQLPLKWKVLGWLATAAMAAASLALLAVSLG